MGKWWLPFYYNVFKGLFSIIMVVKSWDLLVFQNSQQEYRKKTKTTFRTLKKGLWDSLEMCVDRVRSMQHHGPTVWRWQYHDRMQYHNPFPNKPWFLRVCSASLLKTLWKKEKLLVTSNFSFSHSVFYSFR